MSEWSVHVEARGPEPLDTDEQTIENFVDQFTDYSGAAAGGPGFDTYSAQFSVDAPGPDHAVVRGVEIFRNAVTAVGLPEWPIVDAQATEANELDRQLAIPSFPELVGISEIAHILDVTRQRAHQVAGSPAFPEPIARLASGPVWTRPSINLFVDEWQRKPGRPPKSSLADPTQRQRVQTASNLATVQRREAEAARKASVNSSSAWSSAQRRAKRAAKSSARKRIR